MIDTRHAIAIKTRIIDGFFRTSKSISNPFIVCNVFPIAMNDSLVAGHLTIARMRRMRCVRSSPTSLLRLGHEAKKRHITHHITLENCRKAICMIASSWNKRGPLTGRQTIL